MYHMYIQRERYVHMGRLNFATRGIFRFVRAQGEEAEVTKMCVCVCVCVCNTGCCSARDVERGIQHCFTPSALHFQAKPY